MACKRLKYGSSPRVVRSSAVPPIDATYQQGVLQHGSESLMDHEQPFDLKLLAVVRVTYSPPMGLVVISA